MSKNNYLHYTRNHEIRENLSIPFHDLIQYCYCRENRDCLHGDKCKKNDEIGKCDGPISLNSRCPYIQKSCDKDSSSLRSYSTKDKAINHCLKDHNNCEGIQEYHNNGKLNWATCSDTTDDPRQHLNISVPFIDRNSFYPESGPTQDPTLQDLLQSSPPQDDSKKHHEDPTLQSLQPQNQYGGTCHNGTLIASELRKHDNHCGSCNVGYNVLDNDCHAYKVNLLSAPQLLKDHSCPPSPGMTTELSKDECIHYAGDKFDPESYGVSLDRPKGCFANQTHVPPPGEPTSYNYYFNTSPSTKVPTSYRNQIKKPCKSWKYQ